MIDKIVPILIYAGIFVLLIVAIIKNKSIQLSKDSVSIGSDSTKPKSKHAHCKHSSQIILAFKKRDEIKNQIYHLRHKELLQQIMNTAESNLDKVYMQIKAWYLTLLKESGFDKKYVADSREFHNFNIILEAIQVHLKWEVKRMLEENHFLEREANNTWEAYVNSSTQGLIEYYIDLMNKYYKMDSPTRQEVFAFMNPKIWERNSIAQIIEDTIREFLAITKRYDAKIRALEKEIDDEFNALFL